MNNLYRAVAALQYVRDCRVRSPNKWPRIPTGLPGRALRVQWLNCLAELRHFRENFPAEFDLNSADGGMKLGAYALSAKIGNCGELTAACTWYLGWQGCQGHCVAHYPEADHYFATLGQAPNSYGYFPRNFADWNSDAVICDAWADIACPAREYPARWRARMQNWEIMHLDIALRSPLTPQWYDVVDQAKAALVVFPDSTQWRSGLSQ